MIFFSRIADYFGATEKRKNRVGKCFGARAGIVGQSTMEKNGKTGGGEKVGFSLKGFMTVIN